MVIVVVAMSVAIAVGMPAAHRSSPRQRLFVVGNGCAPQVGGDRTVPGRRRGWRGDRRTRSVVAAVTVVAGVALLGPLLGGFGGGGLAAVALFAGAGTTAPVLDGAAVALVADLMAGCLTGGTLLPDALAAAADGADGALRDRCRSVAAALRAGATPEQAWAPWLADPRLAPIARTAVRTTHSGAATADELRRAAARMRAQRKASLQQRVRQASVWVVVPLGLCFLPAFVLVAVVPLVAGLLPSLS